MHWGRCPCAETLGTVLVANSEALSNDIVGDTQVSGDLCPQHGPRLVSLLTGDLGSEFFAGWSLRHMVTFCITVSQTAF